MVDPKKQSLTDSEKMECVVRWLNALYTAYWYLLRGEMGLDELGEMNPCGESKCPYIEKCPCTAKEPYRPTVPIAMNFKVMEQFTGKSSVLSSVFRPRDIPRKDIVPPVE